MSTRTRPSTTTGLALICLLIASSCASSRAVTQSTTTAGRTTTTPTSAGATTTASVSTTTNASTTSSSAANELDLTERSFSNRETPTVHVGTSINVVLHGVGVYRGTNTDVPVAQSLAAQDPAVLVEQSYAGSCPARATCRSWRAAASGSTDLMAKSYVPVSVFICSYDDATNCFLSDAVPRFAMTITVAP